MSKSGITLKQLLSNFVTIERFRFELHDNNRFAFTLGKVQRNHEFLLIIQERYDVLGKEMSELERKKHAIFQRDIQGQERGSRQSTPEENEMSKRLIELNLKIHLEIETFYSNAKILLDHIAHVQKTEGAPSRLRSILAVRLPQAHAKLYVSTVLGY